MHIVPPTHDLPINQTGCYFCCCIFIPLLDVQQELARTDAMMFDEPFLGKIPEPFNPVDVDCLI